MIYNELANISKWIESHTAKNENKLKKYLSLIFNNAIKHGESFNSNTFLKGELNGIQQEMKTQKTYSLFLFRI